MALVTINDLVNTLEDTRKILLSASNGDGIVSRDDLKQLLHQTEDPLRRRFLDFFYDFLLQLENRPNVRITEEVIDNGIAFIREQIMPHFEINLNFTWLTNQKIAQVNNLALPMAEELIRKTADNVILSPVEVSEQISGLVEGLIFDDFGSEAGLSIEPFFLEHPDHFLTPDSFIKALGVEPDSLESEISKFESADKVLLKFIDTQIGPEPSARARSIVELMQANLSDFTTIIRGEEFNPVFESNHPVYVVGIGPEGNLAGFQSNVVWT